VKVDEKKADKFIYLCWFESTVAFSLFFSAPLDL